MKILTSACLLGVCCRYDGGGFDPAPLAALRRQHTLVAACPEQLGGLSIPRSPSERQGEQIWSRAGENVTGAFLRGAQAALALARAEGCRCALLKENSPSCGSSAVYDGSFTGRLVPGEGVTAELLRRNGIAVFSSQQPDALLRWIAAQPPER